MGVTSRTEHGFQSGEHGFQYGATVVTAGFVGVYIALNLRVVSGVV